jgi:hypothetical protein
LSYNLFINNKWDSLISIGKKAINNNIEYFYLDYRIGIAYYAKKNYMNAAQFLEKSLRYNSDDNNAVKYLYYSYIMSNRESEAILLSGKYKFLRILKSNSKAFKVFQYIYLETGPGLSNNQKKNSKIDIDGKEKLYGEIDKYENLYYSQIGLGLRFGKRISIYHSFSNIIIDNQKEICYGINPPYDMTDVVITNNYKLFQNSYYINCRIQFINGFSVIPGFHFINDKFSKLNKNFIIVQPPLNDNNFSFNTKMINNYIYSLNIIKNISKFVFKLSGSYSAIDTFGFSQAGLDITFSPLGNNTFFLNSGISSVKDLSLKNNQKGNLILKEAAGFKILPALWCNFAVTLNNLTMSNESNGLVVYNVPDQILSKYEINILFIVNKEIELSLMYQFIKKENDYQQYIYSDSFLINKTFYSNNLIITGIKWKL